MAARVQAESSQPVLKAGAFVPLTGSAAEQGGWIRDGLNLGASRVQEELGIRVELALEDTSADPKIAVGAFQSLLSREPFSIFFTYGSGVGIALSPLANREKIIQIGLATASPAYRSDNDFNFRNFPSAELESGFLVHTILNDLKIADIAILKIDNDYGVAFAKAFREEFEKQGGRVLIEEILEPKSTDFRSTLLRVRDRKPSLIFIATYPGEGALVLKQARQLGLSMPVVASVAILGSKDFVALAGPGAEGLLVSTSTPIFLESREPSVQRFVSRYREALGEDPTVQAIYAARAYDAIYLSALALKECGKQDSECMRQYLFKVRNFSGASGNISFDRYGDVSNTFTMMEYRQGGFRSVSKK
jgi:branched-chain amino acid transport system substrate-binding protein